VGYWKWLGRGILYVITFRWIVPVCKTPIGEALGGVLVLGTLAAVLAALVGTFWWIIPAVGALLVFTHGWYRDSGSRNEFI